ncbi:cryptochrome/photolyase family protein [Oricola cellulosilytica]|uniref:Cryptochrome/photolyase family protein n=1 Tax=Oricola cellulosilytica TaxID=1429082 RepID=A0A4R0P627_9HYPH|nr:cryptochrome/photolyase family protein [Oricola cellulosilytica]TCD12365.1 cryptochrome/photolyase family protein [Oricola cellulosilytica]
MGKTLRFVLGDQLSRDLPSLRDLCESDVIVMCEVAEEATYVRHHKKKIAFLFSAMRHFAAELEEDGQTVDYLRFEDADGTAISFTQALKRAVKRHGAERVVTTEASEYRVLKMQQGWAHETGVDVEILPDDRFMATREEFAEWAKDRKELRMELFYREMRRKTGYLMDAAGEPEGGRWNYDKENREPLPENATFPDRPDFSLDDVTEDVLTLVGARFGDHFGDLEPFNYPVTRRQALYYLNWFVDEALPGFGTWQDAMKQGEALMFHSHLSALINCGLLDPRECCEKAEKAFRDGRAPLNAVEGFVRQIIGWREYMRGIYWLKMPGYGDENALNARRDLADFFWTGETDMNCLRQSITETRENAYAHHIQRLMVIGNFALLAGLDPKQVQEWYLLVYQDAYEWVEMPNVVGMILYADGGVVASKPYAASGAYIDRMSDYCGNCRYNVKKKNGEKACPFNYLYWNFLIENRESLEDNHRMGMVYGTLGKMTGEKIDAVKHDSERFFRALRRNEV